MSTGMSELHGWFVQDLRVCALSCLVNVLYKNPDAQRFVLARGAIQTVIQFLALNRFDHILMSCFECQFCWGGTELVSACQVLNSMFCFVLFWFGVFWFYYLQYVFKRQNKTLIFFYLYFTTTVEPSNIVDWAVLLSVPVHCNDTCVLLFNWTIHHNYAPLEAASNILLEYSTPSSLFSMPCGNICMLFVFQSRCHQGSCVLFGQYGPWRQWQSACTCVSGWRRSISWCY